MITVKEDKEVGWEEEMISEFPTQELVKSTDNRITLIKWTRFLRDPKNQAERDILKSIREKLRDTLPSGEPVIPEDA